MRGRLLFASISALAVALGCASCSIMPGSGPESFDIRAGQVNDPNHLPYALVKLTPQVVELLAQSSPRLTAAFADRRMLTEQNQRLRGDLLLANADEAFLTSSTRDVHPISTVDGTALPATPGPLTKVAADAFRALQEREIDP